MQTVSRGLVIVSPPWGPKSSPSRSCRGNKFRASGGGSQKKSYYIANLCST